ncbi:DNA polymerase III epsilon subunit [Caenispirillum salinarum AK4]|uniref:DNA polymerase III subunit epsilon n=1 Tax=Caenispirillum salinarum AK4 TaxID=1238182 RepID=K9H3P2_9PROT|nr:DNA polymerase III subunit epsilon [Caenispirillum salinarum]EKV32152.1 DNA polymerase III epsilon subunit [Caenispirillum salinarum AK4]
MREIVLDTETTGFEPSEGHRLVEIGCVELVNHVATGVTFHKYCNPERDMPEEAFRVHGLSIEFLSQHGCFHEIAQEFLDFVGDAPLIIHNAKFDMKFLNAELQLCGLKPLPMEQAVDTVALARRKYPGSPVSLDALCRRFNIDNSSRTYHGALLDSELLAEVYLELVGGREPGLALAADAGGDGGATVAIDRPYRAPRPHAPTPEELEAHAAFVKDRLKEPLWATLEAAATEAAE